MRSFRALFSVVLGLAVAASPSSALQDTGNSGDDDDSGPAPHVAPDAMPLFHDEAPLELRIETNLSQILDDRDQDPDEREGIVVHTRADGSEQVVEAQFRTRGNFRLRRRTCDFPPIRVNFPKKGVIGSVFEGQDKIKLVTHCRDRYESNVMKEYLVYRVYNVITPKSFRVRLARVTWVDTSGEEDPIERLAFFIEMEETVAERLGGEILDEEIAATGIHPAKIRTDDASRVDLFEFMVGNTDFSLYGTAESEPHNVIPVEMENGSIVAVPYDFDWTGMVDANYAKPDPSLGIRNVRERIFRGLCRPGLDYDALFQSFRAHRPTITEMLSTETLLSEDDREEMIEYLDDFWEILDDPRKAEREIQERCRSV